VNKKTVVVLDTNIFISAVLFKGTPLEILQLCISKNEIDIAISPELLAELIGKLKYKFGIKSQTLESLKVELESSMINMLPEYTTQICRDASNNKIIDLAICASAEFIITGDKDLLEIKTYNGIKILTAVDLSQHKFYNFFIKLLYIYNII
jgi:putative PIN family toxin of toxin-antitoxin system